MISPYKGRFRVSQIYRGAAHKGLDLVGLDDKTIYSTVNGTVERARFDTHPTGGMGLYIRVRQANTNRRYYFGHLSQTFVREGQLVRAGERIAIEGNTGNSTGSHLHYEIRSEPSNATFLDVSAISGIPNMIGIYGEVRKEMNIREITATVGETKMDAKLIDGVTYVPLREFVEAIKKELDVTWDQVKGAGVEL